MGKQHSELELFFRKFMLQLGLGYQCYYKNKAQNNRRQGHPGCWSISIWDQRNGHYTKHKEGDPEFTGNYPSQKWYNNQETDEMFEIVGPKTEGVSVKTEHKDNFLKWLLFENDFFEKLQKASEEDYFKHDFQTKEQIILRNAIEGKDLSQMFKEFEEMKEKIMYKK